MYASLGYAHIEPWYSRPINRSAPGFNYDPNKELMFGNQVGAQTDCFILFKVGSLLTLKLVSLAASRNCFTYRLGLENFMPRVIQSTAKWYSNEGNSLEGISNGLELASAGRSWL